MDPLSVIASCIAVIGACRTAVRALLKLNDLRRLPNVLSAIINETSDLTLIVQEIKLSFQSNYDTSMSSQTSVNLIKELFDRAQIILLELDKIINYRLISLPRSNGEILFRRSAWLLEEHNVQRLQQRLRTVRLDIAAGFAAMNLYTHLSAVALDL